jgi:monofunctional biosynthetic peptidoglycan transglycosylase
MVRKTKRLIVIGSGVLLLYLGYIGVSLMFLPSVEGLKNRRMSMQIQVRDWQGKYHPLLVGPKNLYWTAAGEIPAEMKWAVILAEDSNFYRHEGIDVKAIKNAIKYDLEKKRFARGASTITQQLARNLYLTREKTVTRKLKEMILAGRIEQELTKGRIIELYLNVVELGPMVHGIGQGAQYYFGKPASALTPRECAFLAAMLPGPRLAYNPYKKIDRVLRRSEMILGLMQNNGVLSDDEYQRAMAEVPNVLRLQSKVDESIRKEEAFVNLSGATVPATDDQKVSPGEEGHSVVPLPAPVEPGNAVVPTEGVGGK